jgi:glutathione peroxidase
MHSLKSKFLRKIIFLLFLIPLLSEAGMNETSIYSFDVKNILGENVSLSKYKGKVMLIVNTASQCGFTPQYEGLEKLHQSYKDQGLSILGFPSNQFMEQEPESNEKIIEFCRTVYSIQFDMFSKIDVNGENADPLYRYLKKEAPGFLGTEGIKWNFTKFLIDRSGKVLKRYAPSTKPRDIENDIKKLL